MRAAARASLYSGRIAQFTAETAQEVYEQLKDLTRGEAITWDILQHFIGTLDLPDQAREALLALTPDNYIGLAVELTEQLDGRIRQDSK